MFTARIDNFDNLEIAPISGTAPRNIVEHNFPLREGAKLEDLGGKARRFRFKIWFRARTWGESYHDIAQSFIDYISVPRIVAFVHPVMGILKGKITEYGFETRDEIDAESVDIEFAEERIADQAPAPGSDIIGQIEPQYQHAQITEASICVAELVSTYGSEVGPYLSETVNPNVAAIDSVQFPPSRLQTLLGDIDAFTTKMDSAFSDQEIPADSIVANTEFASTLPGRMLEAAAKCVNRMSMRSESLLGTPGRWIDSFGADADAFAGSLKAFTQIFLRQAALFGCWGLSRSYSTDETNRDTLRRIESVRPFGADGSFQPPSTVPPVATVGELDYSVGSIRSRIAAAIMFLRFGDTDSQDLRKMAISLQTYVDKVKIERDRIVKYGPKSTMCLHAICMSLGLSFAYAERIASINNVRNPSFIGDQINVYARQG